MQAYPVHQLIHDEGGTGHVAGVLHDGKEEIENQYVGQEDEHAAHSCYYSVHKYILQPAILHEGSHEVPELADEPVDPVHRVVAQGEGRLEDQVEDDKEYRKGRPFVGDHRVDPFGP